MILTVFNNFMIKSIDLSVSEIIYDVGENCIMVIDPVNERKIYLAGYHTDEETETVFRMLWETIERGDTTFVFPKED